MYLSLNYSFAQSKNGMENYHTVGKATDYNWAAVLHHATKKGLYAEMRYNYEDINTVSIYGGKNFKTGDAIKISVTPMLGLLFGKYKGASFATNFEMVYKKITMSAQLQYTGSKEKRDDNFFYNWSEFIWQPVEWLYGGISVQQTKLYATELKNETGIVVGFEMKKVIIPVYLFGPFTNSRNLMIGLNMEW
ncbi:MAG: hypothetical protein ABJA78_18465 [Ferruginibacter sp.]